MNPRLPNFLIVGAAKAGTTSIYNYLNQHPDIFMCIPKEPHFFSFANEKVEFANVKTNFITKYEDYLALFQGSENYKCRGEATPSYLYLYEKTIKNIKEYIPQYENVKILIVLRNPIDRAYSHYMMLRRKAREQLTFEEAINEENSRIKRNYHFEVCYLDCGLYFKQVKAYMKNFKKIKVCLYDDLIIEPQNLIKEIFAFLDVNEEFRCNMNVKHNVSGFPRIKFFHQFLNANSENSIIKRTIKNLLPQQFAKNIKGSLKQFDSEFNLKKTKMLEKTRVDLFKFYKQDITMLSDLIKKDLSAWLE